MRQSRLMSLVEAMINVVVGYGLAVWLQLLMFPLFGLEPTLGQSLGIGHLHAGLARAQLPPGTAVRGHRPAVGGPRPTAGPSNRSPCSTPRLPRTPSLHPQKATARDPVSTAVSSEAMHASACSRRMH
jgi:hypothetical protein